MRRQKWLVLGLLIVAGCTGSAGTSDDDDDVATGTPTPGWQTLMTGDWTLNPQSEDTSDTHVITLDRDIYVGGIRPIAPLGTHHTVLYRDDTADTSMIYASGLGTGEVLFPDGVGLKLSAGDTLGLQLHIFNAGDTVLSGTSGIEILEVVPSDVVNEADIFLPGPMTLDIPPSTTTTIAADCTVPTDQTVFALFPHMHQLGTHFKTSLTINGTTSVLHDADYYFDGQSFTVFTPTFLNAGDKITTECTWNNTTTSPVGWGESSNSEMCFSILYRYPALGQQFCPF